MALAPHRWKEANECAFFKKGRKTDPANYRPSISLTCVASKILKHIVHHCIMKHLNDQNILTDCQHGFRAKRSTEMQRILILQNMAKAIQSSSIHAVILDYAKAFNKVPHRQSRVFVRARTPGPLLGYFNFCPSYFTHKLY